MPNFCLSSFISPVHSLCWPRVSKLDNLFLRQTWISHQILILTNTILPADFPPFSFQLQENIRSMFKTIQVKNTGCFSVHPGIVLYIQYRPARTSKESKQTLWYETPLTTITFLHIGYFLQGERRSMYSSGSSYVMVCDTWAHSSACL